MVASMTDLAFPAQHRARVQGKATGATPFFAESAKRMTERVGDSNRTFSNILNLSDDGGATQAIFPVADETPSSDGSLYDLTVANLTLATLDDPVTMFHHTLARLKPDGLFVATVPGAESFHEFRHAFQHAGLNGLGRTTPLPDVQECGTLLQRLKLGLPVVDRDVITLTFPDFNALYRSLRAHASHNWHPTRAKGLMTPRQRAAMEAAYRQLFPRPDGRIPVTIELIYLTAWKPHPTQQKSLNPGDGKVSLVNIL